MAKRLVDLQPRERRRVVLVSLLKVAAAWVLVLGAYALTPDRSTSGAMVFARLALDLVIVVGLVAWLTRSIINAAFPQVAAAEALGVIAVVFVALFAGIYLMLDSSGSPAFSKGLDHVKALYMTVTVLSTVGFGDIVARTNTARILVTIQMVLDLVLIGAVVRLLFMAASHGLNRTAKD